MESSKNSLKVLPKSTSDSSVSYFIKYFLLIAADGSAADPVYVIEKKSMTFTQFLVSMHIPEGEEQDILSFVRQDAATLRSLTGSIDQF